MVPPWRTTVRHVVLLVALLLGTSGMPLLAPAGAHTDGATGHVHLHVALGDDSHTHDSEPPDRVTYRLQGTLVVETGPDDNPRLRVTLPAGVNLRDFTIADADDDTRARTLEEEGRLQAVLVWEADPPEAGTPIANVTLSASKTVDPRNGFSVQWPRLGDFDDVEVRVELPVSHTLSSGATLIPNVSPPEGRLVWTNMDFGESALELTIQPSRQGPDPALAHPPNPLGGWLVLLLIALVSGGAWALGKRLESRQKE